MTREEFIEKNIKQQLVAKGYDEKLSHRLAVEAKRKYKTLGNQGGKLFDNMLKAAENRAKLLSKSEKAK